MKRHITILIGCIFIILSPALGAQNYPAKPIRVIVPFPPGGTSDILTRMVGAKLTESWGQQIIPDNRPGANGNIGVEALVRSAPDGYTLILMDVGALTISPSLFKLPFDIIRDLAPVAMVSYSSHMLSVHPQRPGTQREGVDRAREEAAGKAELRDRARRSAASRRHAVRAARRHQVDHHSRERRNGIDAPGHDEANATCCSSGCCRR